MFCNIPLDRGAYLPIPFKKLWVIFCLCEPMRIMLLIYTESKTEWMNLSPHIYFSSTRYKIIKVFSSCSFFKRNVPMGKHSIWNHLSISPTLLNFDLIVTLQMGFFIGQPRPCARGRNLLK